jgi:DNA-binding MarR family transcriptional regulator
MSSTSPSKAPRARGQEPDSDRRTKETGEVSGLEAHLGYWLRAVSNHVSHAFKARVETQGVTVAEWVVLRALFDEDRIKPSELAAKLRLTRGAISKLVDRLVGKSLVSVRSDVRDGRTQLITLRAAGRRLVVKLAALADENDAAAFGHLDPEQRAFLLVMLKRLVEHLGLRGAPID